MFKLLRDDISLIPLKHSTDTFLLGHKYEKLGQTILCIKLEIGIKINIHKFLMLCY